MNSNHPKPFAKKTFFLDLKNVAVRSKLAADLELLGAKEVPLSKSVSFVVSDKISNKENQVDSPSRSNHKSTLDLFDNSSVTFPASVKSPIVDSRPHILTRNMVILQNALKKENGTSNVMEICKKWNIKIQPAEVVLPWVKKYIARYYPAEQKRYPKRLSDMQDSIKKLNGPYLKIEDENKQCKTRYKIFTAWKDIIDPSISKSVTRLRSNVSVFGNINDSVRPPLREVNRNLLHLDHAFSTRSVSLTKISGNVSVSNLISAHPLHGENKENSFCYPSKRKSKELTTKAKRKYCEVCSTHYIDLEVHLASEIHQNCITKEKYFDEVQSVISSLPQASDFISSLTKNEKKS